MAQDKIVAPEPITSETKPTDPLPTGYAAWVKERKWTCSVHDYPWDPYQNEDDWDESIRFEFPPYGCSCDRRAEWVETGRWVAEPSLTYILKQVYLPPIKKVLEEPMFLRLLESDE